MSKILITGGAGFIGSCLAEKLAEKPENTVVVVDNLRTGELRKVPLGRFLCVEVRLRFSLCRLGGRIAHFAASGSRIG
jgi:nucleoside-diphosphate-sugar epimerase